MCYKQGERAMFKFRKHSSDSDGHIVHVLNINITNLMVYDGKAQVKNRIIIVEQWLFDLSLRREFYADNPGIFSSPIYPFVYITQTGGKFLCSSMERNFNFKISKDENK